MLQHDSIPGLVHIAALPAATRRQPIADFVKLSSDLGIRSTSTMSPNRGDSNPIPSTGRQSIPKTLFPLCVSASWRETPYSSLFLSSPSSPQLRGESNFSSWNRPPASIEPITDKPAETGATQRTDRLCCVVNSRGRGDLPHPWNLLGYFMGRGNRWVPSAAGGRLRGHADCVPNNYTIRVPLLACPAVHFRLHVHRAAIRNGRVTARSRRYLHINASSPRALANSPGQNTGIRTPRRQPATIAKMVAPCCCRAKDAFVMHELRSPSWQSHRTPVLRWPQRTPRLTSTYLVAKLSVVHRRAGRKSAEGGIRRESFFQIGLNDWG
jgi:hypothetical protein